jgi:hypothetical protein
MTSLPSLQGGCAVDGNTPAHLYDACGAANWLLHEQHGRTDFAAVWFGEAPEGALAQPEVRLLESLSTCVFVDAAGDVAVWRGGRLYTPKVPDEFLRLAVEFCHKNSLALDEFDTVAGGRAAEVIFAAGQACLDNADFLETLAERERPAPRLEPQLEQRAQPFGVAFNSHVSICID